MRSFECPAIVPPADAAMSIPDFLLGRLARDPRGPMVEVRDRPDGPFHPLSATRVFERVRLLARGLIALGVQPGDRVAIMGRTSWDWTRLDLALWFAGAVPVPIYQTSSPEQVAWILGDAGVRFVFADDDDMADTIAEARAAGPDTVERVLVIAGGALDQVERRGLRVPPEELERRRRGIRPSDLATVIYTSGTTGRPKGVELTHANMTVAAINTAQELRDICGPGSRVLQFLPLAHVLARQINVIVLGTWAVTAYAPDMSHLVEDLQAFRPTFLLGVPRVLEKVYNSAEQAAGRGAKLKAFRLAAKVAIVASREREAGIRPSPRRRAQLAAGRALVYGRLTRMLGGSLRQIVSGGAPLGERLAHFFRTVGITVYEGYGLTETCAPTACNRPGAEKIGTVGPALPATSLAVSDAGEILVKGPHLFRGYRGDPEATSAAFTDDGWFRTGDVGTIDADGYLTITGRTKELIVTAGGKNVAPAPLEDRLRGYPLVSQCVVVGDGRPYVAALITLDPEMLPGWLRGHDLPPMTVEQAALDEVVRASLERAVERANRAVSRAESIRRFQILDWDFTEANGYLTPSLKVKRAKVLRDLAGAIDDLYA